MQVKGARIVQIQGVSMKKMLSEAVEFLSFLMVMTIFGLASMVYAVYITGYWMYAKVTGQEHLIK